MNKFAIAAVLAVLTVCGCADKAPESPLPDLSYSGTIAQPISVGSYTVNPLPDYMGGRLPEGFVPKPGQNVQDYFLHRYRAAGDQGRFSISVVGASVEHSVEKSSNSLGAFLDVAKSDIYTIQVSLRLQTEGIGAYAVQKIDVHGKQRVSMSEHVSLAERERLQADAVNDLIAQLDQEVQKAIKGYFRF